VPPANHNCYNADYLIQDQYCFELNWSCLVLSQKSPAAGAAGLSNVRVLLSSGFNEVENLGN
jgi:hypothetical protein